MGGSGFPVQRSMFILRFFFDQTGSGSGQRLSSTLPARRILKGEGGNPACPVKYIGDMERSEFNWGTI
jgi:hypothetical protein